MKEVQEARSRKWISRQIFRRNLLQWRFVGRMEDRELFRTIKVFPNGSFGAVCNPTDDGRNVYLVNPSDGRIFSVYGDRCAITSKSAGGTANGYTIRLHSFLCCNLEILKYSTVLMTQPSLIFRTHLHQLGAFGAGRTKLEMASLSKRYLQTTCTRHLAMKIARGSNTEYRRVLTTFHHSTKPLHRGFYFK
jgi:hypothetical protein